MKKFFLLMSIMLKFFNGLVIIYEELKQFDKEESYYRNALLNTPDFSDAYYNLGGLYVKQSQHIEAEIAFQKFLSLENDAEFRQEVKKLLLNLYDGKMAICHNCYCLSYKTTVFVEYQDRLLCLDCYRQEIASEVPARYGLYLMAVISILFGALIVPDLRLHYLIINVFLLIIMLYPLGFLGLVIRAVTSVCMGGSIAWFNWGTGPVIFSRYIGDTQVRISGFLL